MNFVMGYKSDDKRSVHNKTGNYQNVGVYRLREIKMLGKNKNRHRYQVEENQTDGNPKW